MMPKIVYLLSDSTGETVSRIGAASLSLFSVPVERRLRVFIRSEIKADAVIEEMRREPGAVIVTMVDQGLRNRILAAAEELGVAATSILQPVVRLLETYLGEKSKPLMGGQYVVDDLYYRRVDAIEYAISHDDGALFERLSRADVILTGVSRTSKTPTCIYLAVRGLKAANLPLIPGSNPPEAFFSAIESGVPVVALTASPSRLAQIRRHRLEAIGHGQESDYASLEAIRGEVADARLLFERIGAPVIDVTRRSIEETAAEIMSILRKMGRL
ncbi:pyruvate, water dikinase regulatory protein [Pikeienuella sp. HZG-20]|uniref:pyruvate, water dikinase regulatory protein n=1 Tax=Paludibacillus litoralis TaxID=3133267 RepID=UPI0030EF23A2